MTGARHFAKENERRQREAVRQAQRERGCGFSACQNLTHFLVRAPFDVVEKLRALRGAATSAARPWFDDCVLPTGEGISIASFYAGPEDAARVRKLLREHGISEVHR